MTSVDYGAIVVLITIWILVAVAVPITRRFPTPEKIDPAPEKIDPAPD